MTTPRAVWPCVVLVALTALACEDPLEKRIRDPVSGIELTLLPAGAFDMGSPETEAARQADERLHRVTLTRPFYLGIHEVTRRQWSAVMPYSPLGAATGGDDAPVVNVSLDEVLDFVARLNRAGDGGFRLPTEAEWEYACRAGTTTAYSSGPAITTADANFDGRFASGRPAGGEWRGALTPVGAFGANPWGLFDLHGNAWEWTADPYCPYAGESADPRPSCDSPLKVIRGGSWRFDAGSARCALRYTHRPQDRGDSLGFRVARDAR